MREPIRVLHVIRLMNHGGVENMIMNLYRHIDRTKVQFDFVQNSNETAVYDSEILSLGGRIYHCPHYNGKNHFQYTKWWNDFFKKHKKEYSIVHGHLGSTAAIYLSIAKKYGCYTIAHSHNTSGNLTFRLFSFPTRFVADHFFACSKEAALSRYGKKVAADPNKCSIIYNAINIEKFIYNPLVRSRMRNQLHVTDDSLLVGHVGQFREQKNHMFLLQIFLKLHQLVPDSKLVLIGEGDLRNSIEQFIKNNNLSQSVILTGARSDVYDFYQAMDVFVMPSLYEGLPVSLIEAQTAGLPCVVADTISTDAAVTDLVEFIPLDDVEKWIEAIRNKYGFIRKNTRLDIQKAGYDVNTTSKWLEDFYLRAGGKNA